jgi:hypothetical protein
VTLFRPSTDRGLHPMRGRWSTLLLLSAFLLGGCSVFRAGSAAPLPPGTNDCIGLERAQCMQLLDSYEGQGNARARNLTPVAWRVRCTTICDQSRGDVEMTVTWSDGTTDTASMGWVGDLGAPPGVGVPADPGPAATPEVAPTCVRVPRDQCEAEWLTSLSGLTEEQRAQVAAILVECRTACTLIEGDGRTTVVLDDGARIEVSDWSYRSGQ